MHITCILQWPGYFQRSQSQPCLFEHQGSSTIQWESELTKQISVVWDSSLSVPNLPAVVSAIDFLFVLPCRCSIPLPKTPIKYRCLNYLDDWLPVPTFGPIFCGCHQHGFYRLQPPLVSGSFRMFTIHRTFDDPEIVIGSPMTISASISIDFIGSWRHFWITIGNHPRSHGDALITWRVGVADNARAAWNCTGRSTRAACFTASGIVPRSAMKGDTRLVSCGELWWWIMRLITVNDDKCVCMTIVHIYK